MPGSGQLQKRQLPRHQYEDEEYTRQCSSLTRSSHSERQAAIEELLGALNFFDRGTAIPENVSLPALPDIEVSDTDYGADAEEERVPLTRGLSQEETTSLRRMIYEFDKQQSQKDSELKSGLVSAQLQHTSYGFMISCCFFSYPFWTGILVLTLKASIYATIVINLYEQGTNNPLGIPAGVSWPVTATQLMAMFITVMTEDDFLNGIVYIIQGYRGTTIKKAFPHATRFKFFFAMVIESSLGVFALVATFLLIIVSEDVIDLILNFTAIEFVSFLDNAAFVLAKFGFIGQAGRDAANKIVKQSYQIPLSRRHSRAPPVLFALTFICLGVAWSIVFVHQFRGNFMEQHLIVQFGDSASLVWGSYSGLYAMEHLGIFWWISRNNIIYREKRGEAIIQYCPIQQVWTFRLTGDDPCVGYMAKSSKTDVYDVTDTTDWTVYDGNGESAHFYEMEDFLLTTGCSADIDCGTDGRGICKDNVCVCGENYHGLRCHYNLDVTCHELEMSQTDSSGELATEYKLLKDQGGKAVLAYNHPIFFSDRNATDESIILYTGIRWAVTTVSALSGFEQEVTIPTQQTARSPLGAETLPMGASLAKYFSETVFHADTSLTSVARLSEPIKFASPSDISAPVGLSLYFVDNLPLSSSRIHTSCEDELFCNACNNNTNPCFGLENGNMCLPDGQCLCADGSFGRMCQHAPVGNGMCNLAFNTENDSYDGGDCCEQTCAGGLPGINNCGTMEEEEFGKIFVGYPRCSDVSFRCRGRDDCYTSSAMELDVVQGAFPTISSNGLVMIVSEVQLDTVSVHDKVDGRWTQRGTSLSGHRDSLYGRVVSLWTPPGSIKRMANNSVVPVVAAIGSRSKVQVVHWFNESTNWEPIGGEIDACSFLVEACTLEGIKVGYDGKSISVQVTVRNDTVDAANTVFTFNAEPKLWEVVHGGTAPGASISCDGSMISSYERDDMGGQLTSGFIVRVSSLENVRRGMPLDVVTCSQLGEPVASALNRDGSLLHLVYFDGAKNLVITTNQVGQDCSSLHGEQFLDTRIAASFQNQASVSESVRVRFGPDGLSLVVQTTFPLGQQVHLDVYGYNLAGWEKLNELSRQEIPNRYDFSADGSTIVLEESNKVSTLKRTCGDDAAPLVLIFPDSRSGISWEVFSSSYGKKELIRQCQHCHTSQWFTGSTIVEEFCIPKNLLDCLQITVSNDRSDASAVALAFLLGTMLPLRRDNTMGDGAVFLWKQQPNHGGSNTSIAMAEQCMLDS